jgi:hypothetical protein
MIVTPLDEIKILKMTTMKDQSVVEIINEKGIKLWNLSFGKLIGTVAKQTISMIMFVGSQNLCKNLLHQKQIYLNKQH